MKAQHNIEDIYELSPMQQGILFEELSEPEAARYTVQLRLTLEGVLDVGAMGEAWEQVIRRHGLLRTGFHWKEAGKSLQVVRRAVGFAVRQLDWRALSTQEQDARLQLLLEQDRNQGFDFTRPPLMRLMLVRLSEQRCQLIWTYHHLLFDGWSLPLLLKEVFTFYEALARGETLDLPAPRPYRDYIHWLQQQDMGRAEEFWRERLRGFSSSTQLSIERPVASPGTGAQANGNSSFNKERRHGEQRVSLSAAVTAQLQALARRYQLTLNTIVQGAWALLLSRYSGSSDVLFGATVSGRPAELSGVEQMLGLFINTLPVRVKVEGGERVIEWLQQMQAEEAQVREYEYTPLVEVQRWSEIERGQALFDSILVFENYPVDAGLREQASARGGLTITAVESDERTNYGLAVAVLPGRELELRLGYETGRYGEQVIERMLGHLGVLLERMAADPQQRVSVVEMLTRAERQQVLVEWNETQRTYPQQWCLHELIEQQVKRTPEAVAVVAGGQEMTYGELNRRANQLAGYLRARGVGVEERVGVLMERCAELVVAMLAIMKAGGAYVPVDAGYPAERIRYMLEDSGARMVLTQESLVELVREEGGRGAREEERREERREVVCVESLREELERRSVENVESGVSGQNLVYVIYTSGSTGRPKGVELQHAGLSNLVAWHCQRYSLSQTTRATQLAGQAFDASVWEIWPYLSAGASLYLVPAKEARAVETLWQWLMSHRITHCFLPTPLAERVLRFVEENRESCGDISLKYLLTGGDTFRLWLNKSMPFKLVNHYGPTENTVVSTCAEIGVDEGKAGELPPIGQPIANTQIYVLDERLQPLPIGVAGEIYIGGGSLARGYLNDARLTAERFIPHPYSAEPGARLYRTSDLGRWESDGNLAFIGRADRQVKIRGFRLELGEIEAALSQHPALGEAVVLLREEASEKRLAAYVTAREGEIKPTTGELLQYLKRKLPEYMLPNLFVMLDEMPLTPGGKVDRRALPALVPPRASLDEDRALPRTLIEELLVNIYLEVLGIEQVGIREDFFELGGHSLSAMQLFTRIRNAFQIELPLESVFEGATVLGLAGKIEEALKSGRGLEKTRLERAPHRGELPLSFTQQQLWSIDQLETDSTLYNITIAVRFKGRLHISILERTLDEIVRRHEVLRTTFVTNNGRVAQVVAGQQSFSLPVVDLSGLMKSARAAESERVGRIEAKRPFKLNVAPLLRATLLRIEKEEHLAILSMHHIISDAWSLGILVREVATLYEAYLSGGESPLPELPVQFADYALWQRGWMRGEALEKQLSYWKKQLGGTLPILELPTARLRTEVVTHRGARHSFDLPATLMEELKKLSRQTGATLFMTLLAVFKVLLYRYTGQDDVIVGTPTAGRSRAEVEGLIGCFLNTLVLRTNLSGNPSFKELLKRVREVALGAYTHQDVPFEKLVEELQPKREWGRSPLFQVAFGMQNAPSAELVLPALQLSGVAFDDEVARFELTVWVEETVTGLRAIWTYSTDLFDAPAIRRMQSHYEQLLYAAAAQPSTLIDNLEMRTDAEKNQRQRREQELTGLSYKKFIDVKPKPVAV